MSCKPDQHGLKSELQHARERVKLLEEALRLREDKPFLAKLADGLLSPVFVRNAQHRFVYLNRAACKHFGGSREELLGKRIDELSNYPWANADFVEDNLRRDRLVLDGAPIDVVEIKLDLHGATRKFVITRTPLRDDAMEGACVIGHILDVTERRRAEDALFETRALLEAAIEQSPTGMLVFDASDERVLISNPAAKISQLQPAPLSDISVAQHLTGRHLRKPDGTPFPPEESPHRLALNKGIVSRNVEYMVRDAGDDDRWLSANAAPIRNAAGEIVAAVLVFSDVTEQRRALQELKASENQYRGLFENTGTATIIMDKSGVIQRCNSRFQMLSGYSRSEVEGVKRWIEFVDASDVERVTDFLYRKTDIWAEPPPTEWEFLFQDRHGEVKNVQIQVDLIPGSRSRVASLTDVTKRRQTEQALRESESRYRTLFESAHDAIFLTTLEGQVIDANQAALSMFRCNAKQILGMRPSDFSPPLQADGEPTKKKSHEYLQLAVNGEPQFFQWTYRRFDGVDFDAEESLTVIQTAGYDYLLAMIRDVTERNNALRELARLNQNLESLVEARNRELIDKARELEQANLRLTELDALKSTLLATVSHDLRTPLTSVLGFAKLVGRDFERRFRSLTDNDKKLLKYADRIRDNLDIIQSEGARLTRLINDFLDLSRIESDRMDWRDTDISAAEAVEQAIHAVQTSFEENPDLSLSVEKPFPEQTLYVDPDRLLQVLINLLDNAAKFSRQGDVRLSASVQSDGMFRITVSDSGPGIPEEDLERIFDKFHRVSSQQGNGRAQGSGLGLAICRRIAEHYNGRIWAESELGHGSEFHLELPCRPLEKTP
ncbi:MAG: PAS domain S-box protein [Desulfovibrionaceae bacterium]